MQEKAVTNELKAKIIAARKEGMPYKEIAEAFGLSRPYVNRICLDAGLKSRKWERHTPHQPDAEEKTETLSCMLLQCTTEPSIKLIGQLLEEMLEAGTGGSFYSYGDIGVSFSSNEVEIVDIQKGTIASLQLRFKH